MSKNKTIQTICVAVAILMMGANLRAPIIMLGSLVHWVQKDLGISSTLMGLVTTTPVLCFAVFSPWAPWLAKRFGIKEVLIGAAVAICGGIVLRSLWLSVGGLFTGTILLSFGISLGNVLLPSVVKMTFPLRMSLMTGCFSAVMSLSSGLASGLAVPLAQWQSWPFSLACSLVLAVLMLASWITVYVVCGRFQNQATPGGHRADSAAADVVVRIWRSPLAWSISLYMGLQSMMYYTLSSWLPAILIDKGISPANAGWYSSILQWVGLPMSFMMSSIIGHFKSQRIPAVMAALCCVCGVSGVAVLPLSLMWLSVSLVSIGAASAFVLSLMFFNLRTDTPTEAARLSAMAQSVGYLVAATGPVGAGWLFDLTHHWNVALAVLAMLLILECGFGWYSAQSTTLRRMQGQPPVRS